MPNSLICLELTKTSLFYLALLAYGPLEYFGHVFSDMFIFSNGLIELMSI